MLWQESDTNPKVQGADKNPICENCGDDLLTVLARKKKWGRSNLQGAVLCCATCAVRIAVQTPDC